MKRLIFKNFQCPGDGVMLSAAVRDLKLAYPDRFEIDVRTACDALFEHNPHITKLREGDGGRRQRNHRNHQYRRITVGHTSLRRRWERDDHSPAGEPNEQLHCNL